MKGLIRRALRFQGLSVRRIPRPLIDSPKSELSPTIGMVLNHLAAARPTVRFVEIGAFDGRTNDPLWPFVTSLGWRGLVVEPQSEAFEALKVNYAPYPNVTPVNLAVGSNCGPVKLFKATSDPFDGSDWRQRQASLSESQVLRLERDLPGVRASVVTEEVEMVTLDRLLAEHDISTLDLLMIDTEGLDLEVLRSADLAEVKPAVVIFEHKHLSWSDREEAIGLLTDAGYRVGEVTARDTAAMLPDLL